MPQAEVPGVLPLRLARGAGRGLEAEKPRRGRIERVGGVVAHLLAAPAEREARRAAEVDEVLQIERRVLLRRPDAVYRRPQVVDVAVAARVVVPGEPVDAHGQAVIDAAEAQGHACAR